MKSVVFKVMHNPVNDSRWIIKSDVARSLRYALQDRIPDVGMFTTSRMGDIIYLQLCSIVYKNRG